ncbi:hypothetical protein HWV62_44241 [Athelia sp. TMB]|nr:hypothetical protein HWV62_44241 [Athelia sp. TMB]
MHLEGPQRRVPPEITDMIIAILRDDRAALNNCSLVAKHWLPSARNYLLARVVLHSMNVDSFINLRASPRCTLNNYLRQLVLTLDPTTGPRVLDYFAGLSAVTTLRISRNAKWLSSIGKAKTGCFPSVTRLEIDGVQFDSFTNLLHIICGFPALRYLYLRDTTWSRRGDHPEGYVLPTALRTVDVEASRNFKWDLLSWMADDAAFMPRSVNLGMVSLPHIKSVGRYIERWGTSLEMLSFGLTGLDPGRGAEGFHEEVDLKLCSSLRLLRIQQFIFYETRHRKSSAASWYHRILDQIDSRHLAEIQLVVFLDDPKQLDPVDFPIDWPAYDQLFAHSHRFAQLSRLVFAVYGSISADVAQREIKRRLPLCDAIGLLHCPCFGFDPVLPLGPADYLDYHLLKRPQDPPAVRERLMIPPEITDSIIDHLHADVATLTKCSLICKNWLPSARHHLFRDVCLRSSNLDQFIALRASPSCSFTLCIHGITLQDLNDDAADKTQTMDVKMSLALRDLPSVTVLILSGLEWEKFGLISLGEYFPHTKELSLSAMAFQSSSEVKNLISGFSQLHRLRIHNTGWSDNDRQPGLADPVPPGRLVFMHLDDCYRRDIFDWLVSDPGHRLEHLDLGIVASADVPSIGRYIRHVGLSLRHLVFGFADMDPGGDAEDFYRDVDLGLLTALRTVIVDPLISGDDSFYQLSSASELIPLILGNIRAPRFAALQFNIYIDEERQLDEASWDVYDSLFRCAGKFPELRHLIFHINCASSDSIEDIRTPVGRVIREKLPECTKRGILRFI